MFCQTSDRAGPSTMALVLETDVSVKPFWTLTSRPAAYESHRTWYVGDTAPRSGFLVPAHPDCAANCAAIVSGKRQIATRQDRIGIGRFSAGTRRIRRDSRGADRTLVGLANRRLRPLGHLTVRLQVYLTQTLTQKRSRAKA